MGGNHARVLKRVKGFEFAGACDLNPDAKKIADAAGVKFYPEIDGLLSAGLDCVDICVPTKYHSAVAEKALNAGLDIFVEKPIADTLENARKITEGARKKGRKLLVGHIERFNPVVNALKFQLAGNGKAIEAQNQGTGNVIASMSFERVGPIGPKTDVGVILDIGIHDIDLARFLSGSEVETVFCVCSGREGEVEDSAQILMGMGNSISAQITVNWLTPFKSRQIDVVAKERFYHADLIARELYARYGFKAGPPPSFVSEMIPVPYAEPLALELEHFLACVEGKAEPGKNPEDSLRALEIALAAMKSAREGKVVKV